MQNFWEKEPVLFTFSILKGGIPSGLKNRRIVYQSECEGRASFTPQKILSPDKPGLAMTLEAMRKTVSVPDP